MWRREGVRPTAAGDLRQQQRGQRDQHGDRRCHRDGHALPAVGPATGVRGSAGRSTVPPHWPNSAVPWQGRDACTNQRFAIAAAMPTAPALAPTPTIRPQVANSCHGAVMNVERPVPSSRSDRHSSTVRRSPSVSIRPVMNGPVMPSSRMLSEIAAEIVPTLQPNACSQRDDDHAGGGAHADRTERDGEGDDQRDPRVVDAPRANSCQSGGHTRCSFCYRPVCRCTSLSTRPQTCAFSAA